MRNLHVDPDLSAYLDGELAPADRARVAAHLAACQRCAARLADLRATASLVSALPSPTPSRSLVPRVAERWRWLRPMRSLSAVASGAFLFVSLITAVAQSGAGLGVGGASAIPAAAPQASAAPVLGPAQTASAGVAAAPPTAAPAPGAFDASRSTIASASPQFVPAAPQRAAEAGFATPTPQAEAQRSLVIARAPVKRGNVLESPLLWFALALLTAILAIAAHVRLRAT